MHVWQWLFTGIVAGFVARLALRRSPIGLGGDLALGALGGLAAGALLRLGGFTDAGSSLVHIAVALIGAMGVIAAMHGLARLAIQAGRRIAAPAIDRNLRERVALA